MNSKKNVGLDVYIRIEFKTYFTDVEQKCALAAASQGKWMNKINLSKELHCSVKTDKRDMEFDQNKK